jgi:hypothetical protein
MNFECDAFISYAHLDNIGLVDDSKGWITNLHRALEVRVAQLLGKTPHIWRDPKLTGNDVFAETLVQRLHQVGALVSVLTPRYVKSEWAMRELNEFFRAAEEQGGVRRNSKSRVFKVLKTPVRLELHPPELQPLLGYEFFTVDPDSGRVHELDEVFGPEARREFWMKLDDLAHDICAVLETMEGLDATSAPAAGPSQEAVFLAEVTFDLREKREAIKRDLLQHGYVVLPEQGLPLLASEMKAALRADLARSRMSIHLVGKNYGFVPEGSMQSLIEIQNELAIERADGGDFSRVLWIPPDLHVEDDRQRAVIEQLRVDPRMQAGADLLETPFEDLRTVIRQGLQAPVKSTVERSASNTQSAQIYLIYDERDSAAVTPWADFLFELGCEVFHPIFEGDEAEVREYHEEILRNCDGALIFFGTANELWLRRKLREVQKSAGYGRTKAMPVVAVALISSKTAEKERFRTHDAVVIPQYDGFSAAPLEPFISHFRA